MSPMLKRSVHSIYTSIYRRITYIYIYILYMEIYTYIYIYIHIGRYIYRDPKVDRIFFWRVRNLCWDYVGCRSIKKRKQQIEYFLKPPGEIEHWQLEYCREGQIEYVVQSRGPFMSTYYTKHLYIPIYGDDYQLNRYPKIIT